MLDTRALWARNMVPRLLATIDHHLTNLNGDLLLFVDQVETARRHLTCPGAPRMLLHELREIGSEQRAGREAMAADGARGVAVAFVGADAPIGELPYATATTEAAAATAVSRPPHTSNAAVLQWLDASTAGMAFTQATLARNAEQFVRATQHRITVLLEHGLPSAHMDEHSMLNDHLQRLHDKLGATVFRALGASGRFCMVAHEMRSAGCSATLSGTRAAGDPKGANDAATCAAAVTSLPPVTDFAILGTDEDLGATCGSFFAAFEKGRLPLAFTQPPPEAVPLPPPEAVPLPPPEVVQLPPKVVPPPEELPDDNDGGFCPMPPPYVRAMMAAANEQAAAAAAANEPAAAPAAAEPATANDTASTVQIATPVDPNAGFMAPEDQINPAVWNVRQTLQNNIVATPTTAL
jgi:hypothetical protein